MSGGHEDSKKGDGPSSIKLSMKTGSVFSGFASIDEEELTDPSAGCGFSEASSVLPWDSKTTLFGRARESTILLKAFHRVYSSSSEGARVVYVHGVSGSGKSSCVENTLRDLVTLHSNGYYVVGKWDQVVTNAPFTGIVEALSDLCDVIWQSGDFATNQQPRIKRSLESASPNSVSILVRLFPQVRTVLDHGIERGTIRCASDVASDLLSSTSTETTAVSDAFKVFVRALSDPVNPIVVFLDDVQWASKGSLDVVEALATDPELKGVLFILAARDGDSDLLLNVPEQLIGRIKAKAEVDEIRLQNLDAGSVHQLICWALSKPPSDATHDLAQVVAEKTLSNPLHIQQYLLDLHSRELLRKDPSEETWVWEIEEIVNTTDVVDGAAEQIMSRLSKLGTLSSATLSVAAFLGFSFDLPTLVDVVRHLSSLSNETLEQPRDYAFVKLIVENGCKERLVEPLLGKEDRYKFSHDSVQRCLYESVRCGEERALLHLHIGTLLSQSPRSTLSVFELADHLNRALSVLRQRNPKELVSLAELNFEAATQSMATLDFTSASHYGSRALECMQQAQLSWDSSQHKLIVDASTLLARACFQIGNFERCHTLTTEVIEHGCSFNEKRAAYLIRIIALRAQNESMQAKDLGMSVLRKELRLKIPKAPNVVQLLVKLLRVRKLLKSRKGLDRLHDEILGWPESHDATSAFISTVLAQCGVIAFLSEEVTFAIFVFLHIVQMAAEQKVFFPDTTPYAFSLYGFVEQTFGKVDVAYQYGRLVLKLLNRPNTDACRSRSLFLASYYLQFPRRNLIELTEPNLVAHEAGLSTGDLEAASFTLGTYIFLSIYGSKNLFEVDQSVRRSCLRLKNDYKQEPLFQWVSVWWQAMHCMMGETESPTRITGEVVVEEEWLEVAREGNNDSLMASFYFLKLELAIMFGFLPDKVSLVEQYCQLATKLECVHLVARLARFSAAIANRDVYLSPAGSRRHLVAFRTYLKHFRKLRSRGYVNETPYCFLLEVESASMALLTSSRRKKNSDNAVDRVKTQYDECISMARRLGFRKLEALATERTGHFLSSVGRTRESQIYADLASASYREWGALAKERELQATHQCLIEEQQPIPSSI